MFDWTHHYQTLFSNCAGFAALWPNFTFYFIADLIFCVSNNDDVFRKDGCVDNIETHSVKNKQASSCFCLFEVGGINK